MDFGLSFIDGGHSALRWRFLLAFQCIPAILLVLGIKALPDSPRFYVSVGRNEEALQVLEQIRGGSSPEVEREFAEMLVSFSFPNFRIIAHPSFTGSKLPRAANLAHRCSSLGYCWDVEERVSDSDVERGYVSGYRSWLRGPESR